ncbi:non-ribosomal peptide synthetase [Paenibacillus ehimensis]|uniref:Amino acid adenylation domain-containing protein n=1 Tax=Paenibacillus ehimensis TaxID=79264 RepID=A0ABT8VDQ7_9BACL|nr:non-ribosomal peptide synthetase [Paenibacillus ehimensis]MDO3679095.1 amino acid adenylation domain-containing protein [Paenibacillus ehimensis]
MRNVSFHDMLEQFTDIVAGMTKIKKSELDPHEHLIELGIDSMIYTKIRAAVVRQFGVDIPYSKLYEELTDINKIALYLASVSKDRPSERVQTDRTPEAPALQEIAVTAAARAQTVRSAEEEAAMRRRDRMKQLVADAMAEPETENRAFLLSKEQVNILGQCEIAGGGSAFNEALAFRIKGSIDLSALQQSWDRLVERHEALRTVVDPVSRTQTVRSRIPAQIETMDALGQDAAVMLEAFAAKPFKLTEPLFRAALIRESEEQSIFALVVHHIIADGWSIGVLYHELSEIYNSHCTGREPELELAWPFRSYLRVKEEWLRSEERDEARLFPPGTGVPQTDSFVDLSTDFSARPKQFTGARFELRESKETLRLLRKASATSGTSLFHTAASLFAAFLSKVTQNRHTAFGVPFAGQHIVGVESLVGNCVEMIGVDLEVEETDSLERLAGKAKHYFEELEAARYFDSAHAEQSCNVVFNMVRGFAGDAFHGTETDYVPVGIAESKYDLFVTLFEFGNELIIRFDYNTGVISEDTAKRWAAYFQQLMRIRIAEETRPVAEINIVPGEEVERILARYTTLKQEDVERKLGVKAADYGIARHEDARVFVLDREMQLAGLGIVGDIYIGPSDIEIYNTNLRGRWLERGELQVLGEEAKLLRIKGRLVSLHVIEERLRSHALIAEAACEHDEARSGLIAYVTAVEPLADSSAIAAGLRKELPSYMIPDVFFQVDDIRTRANAQVVASKERFTETEQQVHRLWLDILQVQSAAAEDDFFQLGGNSLKAMRLLAALQKQFNKKLQLRSLFERPTIRHLSALLDAATAEEREERTILPAEPREHYPASSAQKRLYALHQLDPESLNYNVSSAIEIEGRLDVASLEKAVLQVIARHEALRTYFEEADGTVVQRIVRDLDLPIAYDEKPEGIEASRYLEEQATQFIQPFDLNGLPLVRVKLLKLEETKHVLLLDTHHIVFDGASAVLFAQELLAAYDGLELAPPRIQYKDYVLWNQRHRSEEETRQQEQFWSGVFADRIPVLQLPTDSGRPARQTFHGSYLSLPLEDHIGRNIDEWCKANHFTPYMFFLAALYVLLSKYAAQDDIVIGTAVEGRNHADAGPLLGMFVNTVPMRSVPAPAKTFVQFLTDVKDHALSVLEHADYPFEELVNLLHVPRDVSRNPLFDVLFTFHNNQSLTFQGEKLRLSCHELKTGSSKVDLFFEVRHEGRYQCGIEFNTDLFKPETVGRMAVHWLKLMENIVERPGQRLCELEMIGEDERHELLYGLNDTKATYPADKTIHQLFEEQAERTPERIAVVYEGRSFTYKQLNERSNQLAAWLRDQGVQAETIVGVMVDRSVEMVVAMLGTLKAGGAYLPIDIKLPKDRIDYMIKDSQLGVLITSGGLARDTDFTGSRIDILDERIYHGPADPLCSVNHSRHLAYIIYTSGTTGQPKGVMVEHNNVVRLLFNDKMPFDFTENDVWTMFHSNCFDFSVWEMYGALLYGGKLVVVPEFATKDFERYLALLKNENVTVLNQTPSAFYNLMNLEMQERSRQLRLRYVIFGGEALKPKMLKAWKQKYPDTRLINMYGITETTVHVTYKEIGMQEIISGISNIGKAIPTLSTYVMDEHLNIQPFGVPGELYVGGDGVARGYLNREELTQQRFLRHPHKELERIYRSGDWVRLLPGGEMEYLGRIDHQVKIRGYRIELGEIENRLLSHALIEDAVVLAKEDNQQQPYLCAYFVSRAEVDKVALQAYLKGSLPDYMIPAFFIRMDRFPLTGNGKVDRKMLPEPDIGSLLSSGYEAPHNELQATLAAIWEAALGVPRVGIDDNFFDLGGHSLKATAVTSEIHKAFQVKIPLKELFQHPTVRELAGYIERSGEYGYEPIEPCGEKEAYETSSAQKRLYALQQRDPGSTAYNMPGIFELGEEADQSRIEQALQELVRRHGALRTSFETADGEVVQKIARDVSFQFEVRQGSEADLAGIASGFIRPFELDKAPLFRAEWVKTPENRYLLVDMHHIISDGLSIRTFTDELAMLYDGAVLEPLRIQYSDFAVWHNRYLQSEDAKKQEQYWMNQFRDGVQALQLPYDYARPALQSFEGNTIGFTVNEPATKRLRELAKERECTLQMVLLSAFYVLLSKYSGQDDIVVGVPVAGRPRAELRSVMGMFVNTLALRSCPRGDKSYLAFLNEVKENSLKAYENESYPLERLLEKLNIVRDISRNPLFDVLFDMYSVEAPEGAGTTSVANGLALELKGIPSRIAKFDISLLVLEKNGALKLSFEYCTKLFQEQTIERMAKHYIEILNGICRHAERSISQIEMLDREELHTLLHRFSGTQANDRKEMVHELFEEQAAGTPDRIAVIAGEQRLTYRELNAGANRLAHRLKSLGVGADTLVGVCLGRSPELVTSLLAVLKAGGAYVPLDPALPKERLGMMAERAGLKALVTKRVWAEGLTAPDMAVVCLDDEAEGLDNEPEHNPHGAAGAQHRMYVIYTSGSTGMPKGASVYRSGFANLIQWYISEFEMTEADRVLLISSPSFDLTQKNIFAPLVTGGRLVLLPTGPYDAREVAALIERHGITLLNGTPSAFYPLLDETASAGYRPLSTLRHVFLGGEPIAADKLVLWTASDACRAEVVNTYGPTECTDVTVYSRLTDMPSLAGKPVPIGRPVAGTRVYILNRELGLVPIGLPGELCIAGVQVGGGYIGDAELTASSFVANPYAEEQTPVLYRTGDLARFLPDGTIEYLGRIDHQVKLRGYRIEPGEIEAALREIEGVKDAFVMAREDQPGSPWLVAYVVPENAALETAGLSALWRSALRRRLPDYMVPSAIVVMEELPLSPNGKIDRKALPAPDIRALTASEYEAPRNDIEAKLTEICSEVLGVSQVGINANFFDLGGDSIKAIRITSKLQKYGYTLEIKDIFDDGTLKSIGSKIKSSETGIEQASVEGEAELTPIQRMFFERKLTNKHHWNQAAMIFRKERFQENIVRQVFRHIVRHHDALRMVYRQEDDGIVQYNRGTEADADGALFAFKVFDYTGCDGYEEEMKLRCSELQSGMDLAKGPLVQPGLFRTDEGDHLLIAIHHLVVDGVSWRILFEDFALGYRQALSGEAIEFQAKTNSFREWGAYLQKQLESDELQAELAYWDSIEKADVKPLPADRAIGEEYNKIKYAQDIVVEFSMEETDDLLRNVNRAYNTDINDILLTALGLAIREWTSEERVLINLEGHGRVKLAGDINVNRTIGWFTAQYPLLLTMKDAALSDAVKRVKETLRHVPNKGIGYGIFKYMDRKRVWPSREPEISFNYLGQFDGELSTDMFEWSPLSCGDSKSLEGERISEIDINGMITGQRLAFTISYNAKKYRESTMAEVGASFRKHLLAIIDHCKSRETAETTPSDFSDPALTLEELEYLKQKYEADNRFRIADIYPLTPMQEGMLFHALMDRESAAYFEQNTYMAHGHLDMELMRQSFNKLIERYELLRTVIVHRHLNRPRQVVLAERQANVYFEDVTHLDEADRQAYIEQFERADRANLFELSEDLLIRLSVLKLGDRQYKVIWSSHHILADGWSLWVLMKDFFELYAKLKNNEPLDAPLSKRYIEYIHWLQRQNQSKARAYWERRLEEYETVAKLPESAKAAAGEYVLGRLEFRIDKTRSERLRRLAQRTQTTINTVIQAVWGILLQKVNHTSDVVFGAVVSGRNAGIGGIDELVGLLINTIPVRVSSGPDSRFIDLLKETQRQSLESAQYDYYPLADIQALTALKDKLIHNKMTFQNYYVDEQFIGFDFEKRLGYSVQDFDGYEQTSFDFNVKVVPNEELEVTFSYNELLYDRESVTGVKRHFEHMLEAVAANERIPVSQIEMITAEEKSRILYDFNDTKADYMRQGDTMVELFEAQAERRPDHPAVVCGDRLLTYWELNEQSNRLARALRSRGVGADTIVGLLAEPSLEMAVGILGILKSGGAYLPIDPGQPQERIGYMLADAAVRVLVTAGDVGLEKVDFHGEAVDLCDDVLSAGEGEGGNPVPVHTGDSLAYVIYTSGTTGKAKGVMITHSSLANYCRAMLEKASVTDEDATALLSSYAFDLGYTSVYTALAGGITLHLLPEDTYKEPNALVRYVGEHCTYLKMTPSLFQLLLQGEGVERMIETGRLRLIILGGETFNVKDIEQFYRMDRQRRVRLMNHYGPTESTIGCVTAPIPRDGLESFAGVIGKPLSNVRVYIVDRQGHLAPVGVPGELCVAGTGLARGYLNRPELSAEKFIENPFEPGERLYRTGDLAKWRPDGQIEFIGRTDNQVKIRGFRIEPGEIEAKLLGLPGIKEAVVIARENRQHEKVLAAYLVGDGSAELAGIRSALKESLPHYMVPAHFTLLERMPLTSNGKINRRALPEPDFGGGPAGEYEAPGTEAEAKLAEVWREVLGVERVGIRDNFFDLGGHSLKATVLVSKIHKRLNVEVPLKEVFRSPTLEAMGRYIENSGQTLYTSIEPCEPQPFYETSSAQKRMYLIQQLEKGTVYNMPAICEVEGNIDPDRIEAAFQALVRRHESLRTSFESLDGSIVQRIEPELVFTLERRAGSDEDAEAGFAAFVRPFDLGKAPLFRAALVPRRGKTYLWVDMHHIISDGVSMRLLMRQLIELYNGKPLEPLRIQYKDFAVWQNKFLQSEAMRRQEAYWVNRFEGEIPVLNLPYDDERPVMQSFEGNVLSFALDEALTEGLRKLARETGSTLHMVLLSAFHILLSKYSGQDDIVIGSPVAGRPHADLQSIVGMFVNTLALRNRASGEKRYSEFLKEVKENALHAYENQSYQFEELLDKVRVKRDTSRNPLFDVMFNMSYADGERVAASPELTLRLVPTGSSISKFDLTLHAVESEKTIRYTIEYGTKLFRAETIERIGRNYSHILNRLCLDPEAAISAIEVVTEDEKRQLTVEFNATPMEYPREKTLPQLFEAQAEAQPDRIAAVFGDRSFTYRELNARSNQLARVLRSHGVGPETIVGLMVGRSLEMLVGILGILKAGGAYLPIDPTHPKERIACMLEDAKIGLLATSRELGGGLAFSGTVLDMTDEALYRDGETGNPKAANTCRDLAYVLYTSGSTGNPKGVMVEHRQVNNFIHAIVSETELHHCASILCLTTISFDIFGLETLVPLTHGMKVVIADEEEGGDGTKLAALIERHGIGAMQSTPSRLKMLLEHPAFGRALGGLSKLLVGGEELPAALWQRLRSFGQPEVYNVYGPTETTIWSTAKRMQGEAVGLTIGKPIGNTQIYIVDAHHQLVPIGVPGELCIAGDGVARGYFNRPELTTVKFVDNPHAPGTRMYKTGDLARWLPNGEIEFLGRIDNQVKIRGYRIELGEIENRLIRHESVKEAVVTARAGEQQQSYLCAYVVAREGGEIDKAKLKQHLKECLPEYMIPSYFVRLDSIPLTSNGKVDRKALPAPDRSGLLVSDYEAPQSGIQEALADIWRGVLGVGKIGIHDNFFDLGGHSLKATIVISEIHKQLQIEVPLRELFRYPTIQELSAYIEGSEARAYEAIEPCGEQAWYEASSAQKRMYAVQQLDKRSTAYNMPGVFELEGEADAARIETALKRLVHRHEALRTSFLTVDGDIVQRIEREPAFTMAVRQGGQTDIQTVAAEFVRAFELESAPLFRAELAESAGKTYLLIDMHHIVSDGVSMSILVKEFVRLYNGESLEPLRIQYKDFAAWHNKRLRSGELERQEAYWTGQFEDGAPLLTLPYDYERPAVQSFEGGKLHFALGEEATLGLRAIAREYEATMPMVLLSVFTILLSKYSGQEDIVVGMPAAGRPHADLQPMVGMFANTLALRNGPEGGKTYGAFLQEVKDGLLRAHDHQSYPLEEWIGKANIRREPGRNPLFDVMFDMSGLEETAAIALDGLTLKPIGIESRISKFDLTLQAAETASRIRLTLEYASALFKRETMERAAEHFRLIVTEIVRNPEITLKHISLFNQAEEAKLSAIEDELNQLRNTAFQF